VVWAADLADPFALHVVGGGGLAPGLRFPGQYYQPETGLYYNYHRDYDPDTGRYLQPDPIGLAGGLNPYVYANANPLRFVDPLGLFSEMCHRPTQGFLIPGRHCFTRFDGNDADTLSFDLEGVHPDPEPEGAVCEQPDEPEDDDCVRREMQKCVNYNYIRNNCCHCVEQALKACGQSIPRDKWPNFPINPGPQPGEPGFVR